MAYDPELARVRYREEREEEARDAYYEDLVARGIVCPCCGRDSECCSCSEDEGVEIEAETQLLRDEALARIASEYALYVAEHDAVVATNAWDAQVEPG